LTKADLVDDIAKAVGMTKVETEAIVNRLLVAISNALQKDEGVEIRGFGTFKVREKQPRVARNPRTGEKVDVPRRFVPTFKPSKELKLTVDRALNKASVNQ